MFFWVLLFLLYLLQFSVICLLLKLWWVMMLIMLVMVLELYSDEVLFFSILMCLMIVSGMVLRLVVEFILDVDDLLIQWMLLISISMCLVFRWCRLICVELVFMLLLLGGKLKLFDELNLVLSVELELVSCCSILLIEVRLVCLMLLWVRVWIGIWFLILVCLMWVLVIFIVLRLVVDCVVVFRGVKVIMYSVMVIVNGWWCR